MVIDPGQITWRALDLKFPQEETESDWSDWSDGDAQVLDVEDKDCTVVDGGDDDEECNGQVLDEDKNTNSKIICPGKLYPASKAKEIDREWIHRHADQMGEYWDMCDDILDREDDDDTPLPPFPLKLLPPTTALCALDAKCYHRVYKTHDTSTTPSILGYREPQEMLQFFSMRLSSSALSYPVSVYGIFAVQDDLDQRRNYVFNYPRDVAVEIVKQTLVKQNTGQTKSDEQQGLADDAGVESAATTRPIKDTNEDDMKAHYLVRSNFLIHACS